MRILFLTQVLPFPLVGGAKIRAYYMLRQLAQNHSVTLISFIRDDDERDSVDHLRTWCTDVYTIPLRRSWIKNVWALIVSLVRGRPVVIARDRIQAMESMIETVTDAGPYDIVHADQTAMAQYALLATSLQPETRAILDAHNAMYVMVERQARYLGGWQGPLWRREARLLREYEAGLISQLAHVLTVSHEDEEALLSAQRKELGFQQKNKLSVVPICVDAELPMKAAAADGAQILAIGTMFWPPNVDAVLWFSEEVLPLIRRQVPGASFTIVGKSPPESVRQLTELPGGAVRVTGFVEDLDPILRASQVMVVPIRAAGGMRVKILTGWLWGMPIVSTSIGAEGIATRPGENILLADEPESFAKAVISVLTDRQRAASLRHNGRRWVETCYDWRRIYPEIEDLYQTLIESHDRE
ncbi:MAG: glycosyltransferase family 4 protein [Candidatus Promineifilaceae bacterium]|nr:glycosyltransferase family 4 protein [Candidatus Promineifilaceae bacterium]